MGTRYLRLVFLMAIILLFTACGSQQEKPWITVGDSEVYRDELMIYLYQTHTDFEAYGGVDVWLVEDFSGGKSAGEVAKQGALENLIKSKVLSKKAMALAIDVTDDAGQLIEQEAAAYYANLPDSFVMSNNISQDTLLKVFEENHLSVLVTERTMANYSLEASEIEAYININEDYRRISGVAAEDVLTTYRVQHLVIRTHERSEDGVWQPLSQEEQEAAKTRIESLNQALLEGADFYETVLEASELDAQRKQAEGVVYNKAQLPEDFCLVLDEMTVGGMTEILQGETGYHIFLLEERQVPTEEEVTAFEDRFIEWEKALKAEAEQVLTREAFDNIYMDWRDATQVTYSQQWTELTFEELLPSFKGQETVND